MSSKRSSRRRSADIIGGNDDLMQEIFLFLPAKSLIRFQSACKRWRSLISAASFLRLHTLHHRRRRQPQPSFLLRSITSQFYICHPTVKKLVPFRFPFRCKFARFAYNKILQSCNGLLLLECWNTPYGTRFYFVYNPTTMNSRELSVPHRISGLCLVFDPSISPHYKVLCFKGYYTRYLLVYDSETHSWTYRLQISTGPKKIYGGVYINDGIYFIRSSAQSYRFILDDDFYEISKVPKIRGGAENYVMESNGHLHYVVLSRKTDKTDLRVFEMNKGHYGWFEKYRVNLDPISVNNGATIRVVGLIRGEKEEDSIMLLHVRGKIMIYRFHDEIFEVLVNFRRESYFKEHGLHLGFTDSYQFIDTLALV